MNCFAKTISLLVMSTALTLTSANAIQNLSPDTDASRINWLKLNEKFGEAPNFKKDTKLGAIAKTLTNEFWVNIGKGYEYGANKFGATLSYQAAANEEDPMGQLNIAESLIAQNSDAILASPQSDVTLQLAFEEALKSKIPFINVTDAVIPQTRYFVGNVHFYNGMEIANWFLKKYPEGAEVAVIEGQPLVYATTQRTKGFVNTLKKNHDIKVVSVVSANWLFEDAREACRKIMKEHPRVIGIYCHNDNMALGAVEALKEMNQLSKVAVFGTDGISTAYEAIEKGELTGTVDSFPEVTGAVAVEVAARILSGQKIPRVVATPQVLITRDNYERFKDRDIDKLISELKK